MAEDIINSDNDTISHPQKIEEEEPVPEWMDVVEFPNVYTAWDPSAENYVCDRRLSRAARRVLKDHLLHTVFRHEIDDEINQEDGTVYDLLDRWMATVPMHRRRQQHLERNSNSCPRWQPFRRDVYRNDEDRSQLVFLQSLPGGPSKNLKIAYPHYVFKQQGSGTSSYNIQNLPEHWYQCGYCGKTFSTQFYLDLHMTRRHDQQQQHVVENGEENNNQQQESIDHPNNTTICPAVDWCHLVGMANCHAQAVKAEPYYDRGSDGSSLYASLATLVKHKWNKIAHSIPCDEEQLQQHCRSVMVSCGLMDEIQSSENGEEDDDDDWAPPSTHDLQAHSFCQALTCPRKQNLWQYLDEEAHDLFLLGNSNNNNRHKNALVTSFHDHWRGIWTKEAHHHHHFSWMGAIIFVCFLLLVARFLVASRKGSGLLTRQPVPAGKRLLSKRGRLSQSNNRVRIKGD